MSDRRIVYTGEIPLSADFLQAQKNSLRGLGQGVQDALFGIAGQGLYPNANTVLPAYPGLMQALVGLSCSPAATPNMTVTIGPGAVYQVASMDTSAFGSLASDNGQVLQQGISLANITLPAGSSGGFNAATFAAPGTAGQSINYLAQVQFQQNDGRPLILNYYNSGNPSVPFIGQNGNGLTQNTDRLGVLAVQVVQGVAAATGTQTTPIVTAGWLPAYVITVAYGQTTITASSIFVHASAPFLAGLTQQHHLGLPGTAPKIDLTKEVQGILPNGNLPNPVTSNQMFGPAGQVDNGIPNARVQVGGHVSATDINLLYSTALNLSPAQYWNAYYNGTVDKYFGAYAAFQAWHDAGGTNNLRLRAAAAGTAGGTVGWTDAIDIMPNGRVVFYGSTEDGSSMATQCRGGLSFTGGLVGGFTTFNPINNATASPSVTIPVTINIANIYWVHAAIDQGLTINLPAPVVAGQILMIYLVINYTSTGQSTAVSLATSGGVTINNRTSLSVPNPGLSVAGTNQGNFFLLMATSATSWAGGLVPLM